MEEKTNFFEKFWYIFVILALVLVGVVAGLWFYNQKTLSRYNQTVVPTQETMTSEEDTQTATLDSQSDSDEVAYIEADLQNTDLSNLDKEMADIENEISNP